MELRGALPPPDATAKRALLVGHFSTVGDIECLEFIKRVLSEARIEYDIAAFRADVRRAIPGAISPQAAKPNSYSHLLVVCGPYSREHFEKNHFEIERYTHCNRIGLNVTMVDPLTRWNPFDVLIERDLDSAHRPDLTFLMGAESAILLGRCVIEKQPEYGQRQRHAAVIKSITDLTERRKLPAIDIDTRWPTASTSLNGYLASGATNALISRVNVLVTNRLHGLVFAIRNGVPALAIDAVAGGDKVTAQARTLQWPICLQSNEITPNAMDEALEWCLTQEAKAAARHSRDRALALLSDMEQQISSALMRPAARENTPPIYSRGWHALKRILPGSSN